MKVALGAILRDEFPYILEWIAHHRNMGIEHFFIANHGSTDGSTELLEALEKLGIITTFYIPGDTDAPQIPAYDRIMRENRQNYDWIGFMDLDEFWIPTADLSLKEILQNQPENSGGVVFNWAIYGSSFQKYPDDEVLPSPVTARFGWRAEKYVEANELVKSFIKTKAYEDNFIFGNAHSFPLSKPFIYAAANGEAVDILPQSPGGKSTINWEIARINHYLIKSEWEFYTKKINRGLADNIRNIKRDRLYFQIYDQNHFFEPLPLQFQLLRDLEMTEISEKLQKIGYRFPEKKPFPQPETKDAIIHGIKDISYSEPNFIIEGWAIDRLGRGVSTDLPIYIYFENGERISPKKIEIFENEEIRKLHANSAIRSGFKIYFEITESHFTEEARLIVDEDLLWQGKIMDLQVVKRKNFLQKIFR